MKISTALSGHPDAFGRVTIYIRKYHQGKRTYHATPYRVLPEQFQKGLVVGLKNARQINDELRRLVVHMELEALESAKKGQYDPFLKDYMMDFILRQQKSCKPATHKQNMEELNKFCRFPEYQVKLSQVDTSYLYRYRDYLLDLKNGNNTVWKSFKFLKKILRHAFLTQTIERNPFIGFDHPKYVAPQRIYVTDKELARIHQIAQNPEATAEVRFIATWFLIGCYTALRYSDWNQFEVDKHIKNNRLILHTTKTGEVISMPLVSQVKKLLEAAEYKGMHFCNQYTNRVLREIGKTAGIKTPLTAHIARHTFGVRAAHVMSLESCARLMGITVKVCSVYYKIIDKVSDKEYQKLFKEEINEN